jgi:prepilin peptidase CpaA
VTLDLGDLEGLDTLTFAQFVSLMIAAVACVADVRTRRIPNVLTFGAAALGFGFHGLTGGLTGLGSALAGWAIGTALFLPIFALRGMGGGDIKLLGGIGAWLGPADALFVGLYGAIAGGVLALTVAVARGYLRTALSNLYFLAVSWRVGGVRPLPELTLETSKSPRLAYAVPVFAGLAVTLWLRH